ncbi:MAG: bifunctional riboflavin kinase/FAD synthetase [Candidatus Aminicenantes bacterium]|nr:bifunctional riboflavin kinase/FAD synthetase [Candidatus Aminicenantes bacterium]
MKVLKGLEKYSSLGLKTALAIGNFDGVHLGHQKIIKTLVKIAKEKKLVSSVLTFDPHPEKFFNRSAFFHIQTLDQRLKEISNLGIQTTVVASFDKSIAELTAEEFISKVIKETFQAKVLVVGENFRFGIKRKGDVARLQAYSPLEGFQLFSIQSVKIKAKMVSSSLIRELLTAGDVEKARLYLGRPYELDGIVFRGSLLGKSIGFPTANLKTENEISPPGVFLTRAQIDSSSFFSLTNIGSCPTFSKKGLHIETHLLHFDGNLYGKKMRLFFLKKIRDEIKFSSPENLALQINRDLKTAQKYFFPKE